MGQQSQDGVVENGSHSRSGKTRSAKRSRKGCPECRKRKVKCDERHPRCGQCRKSNRECHLQDSVFKQHVLSTPIQDTRCSGRQVEDEPPCEASDNIPSNEEQSAESVGAEAPDTTGPYQVALDSPTATVTERSQDAALYAQVPLQHVPAEPTALLLTAADQLRVDSQHGTNPIWKGGTTPRHFTGDTEHRQGPESPTTPLTTNSADVGSTIGSLKDTQEELFLLRHYSECIAPWMDLLYRYEVFSREVLTLARQHPILRYAACAVAAKQLGQMRSPVSTVLRGKTQEIIAANLTRGRLGFVWYGIKYYEKAIQTLVRSITPREPQSATPSANNHASPAVSLSQGDLMVRADGEDPIVRLLGTCILIQYEHLSANRDAWSGHLTGFSKLLDLVDDGKLLERYPMFEQVYPWTKDIMEVKAGFWNFVVNDLEESFVSHRRTLIDTRNLSLWRNMGLLIEDDGRLSLTSGLNSLANTPEHARDKVLSYTLIRLLCMLVDYLSPPSHWESLMMHTEPSTSDRDKATFVDLESQFDAWIRMLSPSFHPDGTFFTDECGEEGSGIFSREVWFSNDLCSTTMMYYHMARMILLIHRPSDLLSSASTQRGGISFDLLRTFRGIEQRLQSHAAEVISIVRGTPCDAVKLRAIQPLYVAGRCCASAGDRKMLVEMLTDIQDNLGIATGYRINVLLQEWGASYQDFGMEARLTAEEQLG